MSTIINYFWALNTSIDVWSVVAGGVMVMLLARDSRPFHFQVTNLGKLFTHVPLSPSSIIW